MKISVVIPVYNEEQNVSLLHKKLSELLSRMKQKYEIIFVDDGSTDNTFRELSKLKNANVIKFRKNFGQTAAMSAGFREAKGDIIISMDGDLQNNPEDIPRLVNKIQEGYDVVCGWRIQRNDTFTKKLLSRIANTLRRILITEAVHDSGCSLKAYRRECFEDIDLYGEMHRYIPALLGWKGFKITEIKVSHHQRKYGKTKYGYARVAKGLMDLINVLFWRKYSTRPLHLFGGTGLVLSMLGLLLGFGLVVARHFYGYALATSNLPLLAVFLFVIGLQFFISGLMADISVKNYYGTNGRRNYSIEKIVKK